MNSLKDMYNNFEVRRALSPGVAVTNNTAQVSQIIDMKGYQCCMFYIATGTLSDSDATFTVLIEDGAISTLSDNAAVDDAFLLGTESGASFTYANDDAVYKIGYVGIKRYVRMTITPANNTGDLYVSVIALLGGGNRPTP